MWTAKRAKIKRGSKTMTKLDIALYIIVGFTVVAAVIGFVRVALKDDDE